MIASRNLIRQFLPRTGRIAGGLGSRTRRRRIGGRRNNLRRRRPEPRRLIKSIRPPIGSFGRAVYEHAHPIEHTVKRRAPASLTRLGKMIRMPIPAAKINLTRSEEHTSELQSLMRISYAVFCLQK